MNHAEKCPVCGGSGKILNNSPPYYKDSATSIEPPFTACNGCGGSGWVTVQDTPVFWPYPTTEIDDTTTGGAK